ncbi:MAG: transglutaminase-like domain-containing protein [Victivallales bacterium]|nr:transglutaminase-like domain-containing protein [Victivallales bacterium]
MTETSAKTEKSSSGRPERITYHWHYFMVLGLGMTAALWLYGQPVFTLVLLGLLLPCALVAYVPYRYFSHNRRLVAMVVVAAVALGWGGFRFFQGVAPDKLLIESLGLLALCFAFSPRRREMGYLLLIAVLLLIYGALRPRAVYLVIAPAAFFLIMRIFYGTRVAAISGDPGLTVPQSRGNRWTIVWHLAVVSVLGVGFYFLFPREVPGSPEPDGAAPWLSVRKPTDVQLHFMAWFRGEKARADVSGTAMGRDGSGMVDRGESKLVFFPPPKAMKSCGNCAAPPGKELVFRAESPAKLYWVGQLYDHYDGDRWTASTAMIGQRKLRRSEYYSRSIPQRITMEKWVAPVLFAAYRTDYITFNRQPSLPTMSNFFQYRLRDETALPPLPFTYTAYSEVESTAVLQRRRHAWMEPLPPQHYLQLPEARITSRVRKLAAAITGRIVDPYAKALALRDYLRNNYRYQMLSRPNPVHCEAVDFFLFELREGHCEYFASSLAVLARLCRLPSRVVTGFSPGNYNVLTRMFEVYEYHAHAWTQIFIERYGWLTFDATPPGALVSVATPQVLGHWDDPFGREWQVRPPELAAAAQQLATPAWVAGSHNGGNRDAVVRHWLGEISRWPEQVGAAVDYLWLSASRRGSVGKGFSLQRFFRHWRQRMTALFTTPDVSLFNCKVWLRRHWWSVMAGFAVMIVFLLLLPRLMIRFGRFRVRRRCRKWLIEAAGNSREQPASSIRCSYWAVRQLLELHGLPGRGNLELLDYATLIATCRPQLGPDILAVFFLYIRMTYSAVAPTEVQARIVLERAEKIRDLLAGAKRKRFAADVRL